MAGPECELVARIFVCPTTDLDMARFIGKRMIAAYLTVPVYAAFHQWLGRGEIIEPMLAAWNSGDRKGALAAIPDELVDELFIHGAAWSTAASASPSTRRPGWIPRSSRSRRHRVSNSPRRSASSPRPDVPGPGEPGLAKAISLIRERRSPAQLCVVARGEVVADESFGCQPDALFFLFSASKPLVALLVHLLAERGELTTR